MVLHICEKFHHNISKGFQLLERTILGRNGYVQHSKGNNSKSRQTSYGSHVLQVVSVLYICVKFHESICGSCQAQSVYLTTLLPGRLSPPRGYPALRTLFRQKLTTTLLESVEGRE